MGYAILRTQKLKSGQAVRRSLTHAFREQETPNADPERTPENSHIGAENVQEALERFNARLPDKVRKNAVLCIEYLITASPEDLHGKTRQEQDAYFRDALKWLQAKHGAENVVYVGVHRDETTPHLYAYIVPIDDKGRLNCRKFLGGAAALSEMQTDFAEKVGVFHNLKRGIEGSKAKHTTLKRYYARVNAPVESLPQVKTIAPQERSKPVEPGFFSSKSTRNDYERDLKKWEHERSLILKHRKEIELQKSVALKIALANEAKALELMATKIELDELKSSNSSYAIERKRLKNEMSTMQKIVNLFRPTEIQSAIDREKLNNLRAEKEAKSKNHTEEKAPKIEMEEQKRLQMQRQEAKTRAEHQNTQRRNSKRP